jgi:hypothetical protein
VPRRREVSTSQTREDLGRCGLHGPCLGRVVCHEGWELDVVGLPKWRFKVQPRRSIIKCKLSWLLKSGRLALDYERTL